MKEFLKYFLLFLVISLVYVSVAVTFFRPEMSMQPDTYSLKIKQHAHGWFYEIYDGDDILIKQETIPAIAGNYYFVDKKDAETIGAMALSKIREGLMPPTISLKEIESAHIKKRKH